MQNLTYPKPLHALSGWTLRLDGGFLVIAGTAALLADTAGHFFGVGPLAMTMNSPYTIGSFEAHGLAVILGFLLLHAVKLIDRQLWHALGLSIHLLLGTANLLFWSSFLQLDVLIVGIVTTALHFIFVGAQAVCLRREIKEKAYVTT
ncbi:MAG TPA: hypothetical protein VJS64_19900 [Pyrinomonadaceae bacterium]|nr:hypothetical protein [Pyrinomonadaceae bacterium]